METLPVDHVGTSDSFSSFLQLNVIMPQNSTGPKGRGSCLSGSDQACFWPWEMSPRMSGIIWAGRSNISLKKDLHLSKSVKKGQVECPGTFQMNKTFNSSENTFVAVSYLGPQHVNVYSLAACMLGRLPSWPSCWGKCRHAVMSSLETMEEFISCI